MSDWFVGGGDGDGPRVFCFPHAGGSPRGFLEWQVGVAEVVGVCRPGREHRSGEAAPSIEELIEGAAGAIAEVAARDGRACYLFGHSLGGLVAFEVCRRLAGRVTVGHLVVSGCSAASLLPSERVKRIATLSGAEFAREIGFFGGLAPEVIDDPELRDLLLPGLIADFRMAVGYRYRAGAPLAVPATLVVGRDDPHVKAEQIGPWDREFTWAPERVWLDGGHFYFEPDPGAVTGLLRSLVLADQHVELI